MFKLIFIPFLNYLSKPLFGKPLSHMEDTIRYHSAWVIILLSLLPPPVLKAEVYKQLITAKRIIIALMPLKIYFILFNSKGKHIMTQFIKITNMISCAPYHISLARHYYISPFQIILKHCSSSHQLVIIQSNVFSSIIFIL